MNFSLCLIPASNELIWSTLSDWMQCKRKVCGPNYVTFHCKKQQILYFCQRKKKCNAKSKWIIKCTSCLKIQMQTIETAKSNVFCLVTRLKTLVLFSSFYFVLFLFCFFRLNSYVIWTISNNKKTIEFRKQRKKNLGNCSLNEYSRRIFIVIAPKFRHISQQKHA